MKKKLFFGSLAIFTIFFSGEVFFAYPSALAKQLPDVPANDTTDRGSIPGNGSQNCDNSAGAPIAGLKDAAQCASRCTSPALPTCGNENKTHTIPFFKGSYMDSTGDCCCYDVIKTITRTCVEDPVTPGSTRADNVYSGTLLSNIKTSLINARKTPQGAAYFTQEDLPKYIGEVIKIVLGLLGIIFLGMILFAGFKWFTAAGDEKKVADAISMINQALFGLAIVIGAYVITNTVVNLFDAARQATFLLLQSVV